jgi:quercetin dioxygenase-like cupin family protein
MKPSGKSLVLASSLGMALCGCAAPSKDLAHRQTTKSLPQLVRFYRFTQVRRTAGALYMMGGGSAAADGGKYDVTPPSSLSSYPQIELTVESTDPGALDSCQRQVEAARQYRQPIDIRGMGHFTVRSVIDPPLDTNIFTLTQLDACGAEVSTAAVATPAVSSATVPSPDNRTILRKVLERSDIPGTGDELQMILIEYPPGAAAPPHLHPVVGLNYILEGAAESQYEGEPVKTFHAGDSYQDPANRKHLIFRNASKTEVLRFIVTCRIPKGQSFTRELPEAGK